MQDNNQETNRKDLIEDFFRHVVREGKFSVLKDFITSLSIEEKEELLIGEGDLTPKLTCLEMHPYKILKAKLRDLAPLTAFSWDKPKTSHDLVLILKSNMTVKTFRELDRNGQVQKMNELKQNSPNEDEFLFELLSDNTLFTDDHQIPKYAKRSAKASRELASKKKLPNIQLEEILEQSSEQNSSLVKDPHSSQQEGNEEEKKEPNEKQSFNTYQSFDYEFHPTNLPEKQETAWTHKLFAREVSQLEKDGDSLTEEALKISQNGEQFKEEGQLEKALECFNQALKLRPIPMIYIQRAETLFRLERYSEAIEDADYFLKELSNEDLRRILPLTLKIDAFSSQGEYGKAEETVNELIKFFPDLREIWQKKVSLLFEQKNFESAVECADQAIEHFGNRGVIEIYKLKIKALASLNKFILVEDACDKLIEIEKAEEGNESIFSYVVKGFALKMQGRIKEAKECFEKGIQLNPKGDQELVAQFFVLKSQKDLLEDSSISLGLDVPFMSSIRFDKDNN